MIDIKNRVLGLRFVPANELIPNPKNPREHPAEQLGALSEALEEIGFAGVMMARRLEPAAGSSAAAELEHSGAGGLMLLDGHGRQKLMGTELVPVVILDITEEEEAAFFLTFDPLSSMAGYNRDVLRDMMADLMERLGDRREKIRAMCDAIAKKHRALPTPGRTGQDPGADMSRATELKKKWGTAAGQVWLIPSMSRPSLVHCLIIGDSAMPATWAKLAAQLGGLKAECLWTDPPYGVDYIGKTKSNPKFKRPDGGKIQNDSPEGLRAMLVDVFKMALQHLAPGGRWYVAGSDKRRMDFLSAFAMAGMIYRQGLIWVKNCMVLGHTDYHYAHEDIFHGISAAELAEREDARAREAGVDSQAGTTGGGVASKNGRGRKKPPALELELFEDVHYGMGPGGNGRMGRSGGQGWYGDNSQTTVFHYDKPSKSLEHPTMKPPDLIGAHLYNSTRVGDLVFDPFAGSGSTMVAAEQLSRRCAAIEIDPGYAAVILDRMMGMGCSPVQHRASGRGAAGRAPSSKRPARPRAAK